MEMYTAKAGDYTPDSNLLLEKKGEQQAICRFDHNYENIYLNALYNLS